MTEELYIYDDAPQGARRADMDKSTQITFAYKSNILGDLSKITANYSYTIKLPKTATNRNIFNAGGAPDYPSRFPRRYHKADYYRNGVLMIRGARLTLVEATATDYQCQLVFGLMQGAAGWLSAGKGLQDLTIKTTLKWNAQSAPNDYPLAGFAGYSYFRTGIGLDAPTLMNTNLTPSVSVFRLLLEIARENGFSLSIPDSSRSAFIRSLILPVTTFNASPLSWVSQGVQGRLFAKKTVGGIVLTIGCNVLKDPNKLYDTDKARISFGDQSKMSIVLKGRVPFTFTGGLISDATVGIIGYDSDGNRVPLRNLGFVQYDSSAYIFDYDFELEANSGVETATVEVQLSRTMGAGGQYNDPSSKFTASPQYKDLTYPCDFPIVANLPKIKQIDFIKAIANLCGLFAVQPTGNDTTLRLLPMEALTGNRANAYDWSDAMDARGDEPDSVKYNLSGLAQRNLFKWKADPTGDTFADGVVTVEDKTIDPTADKVKQPFAGTSVDFIPLFKLDDKGEVERVKVEPRIMVEYDKGGASALTFVGLDYPGLIDKYFAEYQAIVLRPTVIKQRFRLNEVVLSTIDFTRPVYLRQYGRFFGIVSLQTSGEFTNAELILLPLK